MRLHGEERLVELHARDDEADIDEQRQGAILNEQGAACRHDHEGEVRRKAVGGQHERPVSRCRLAALAEVRHRRLEPAVEGLAFGKGLQQWDALYVLDEQARHVRRVVPASALEGLGLPQPRCEERKRGGQGRDHEQRHAPIDDDRGREQDRRDDEVGCHPRPEVPHHHLHVVDVLVDDVADLAQALSRVEAQGERLQPPDDGDPDLQHEVESRAVLLLVGHDAACPLGEEKADERHPVGNEVGRSGQDRMDCRENGEGHRDAG